MQIVRDAQGLAPFHGCVFVPTMGALHAGHASLIHAAREIAGRAGSRVVVSLFVNPTQFDDPKDFQTYPRNEEHDAAMCAQWGVDVIFAPPVELMYPHGAAKEPVHDLVQPTEAIFGEKDWQQLQVIRAVVAQDKRPIRIVPGATVREADGLALSSRNVRLNAAEREQARAIPRSLVEAGKHADPAPAERAGRAVLEGAGFQVEYFAVRDEQTLEPWPAGRVGRSGHGSRVIVACRTASTRLIDNAPWPGWTLG